MSVTEIASEIVNAILAPLTDMLTAVPQAIVTAFQALFITTTGTGSDAVSHISIFGIVMLVFGGVALAFGLTKLVYHLVSKKVGA